MKRAVDAPADPIGLDLLGRARPIRGKSSSSGAGSIRARV